ncbi:MAG: hypothetical protein HN478_20140 [Rhodospirillaceae bacterium]|jgi:hypothetical protein|nr:hypothetical protein [Rhodospirillaceae bacterium]MBT4486860.1 hypothetical protein [Rhodospirillaceae bacterium]MBT5050386.1 hypothetical protein [Rhodospirillaceae bacterium]MBT5457236.1 hypothetical protein [Rhodospirillaceae bacterium]MBT5898981.1 hypothetical protein [Rhodospirillaceae bacterium]
MPFTAKYAFMVSMDVQADKEDLFNEVYDQEHIPALLEVDGVVAVSRLKTVPATLSMGGEELAITGEGMPHYIAIYEVDSPDVLNSPAWAEAVEAGRWAGQVRPFTTNRQHVMRKLL